ncbi:MAG TPA: DUF3147 family protein [Steroidobacteraceae bacterium]|jgi:uncharacterized membrane protein (GlpM family)
MLQMALRFLIGGAAVSLFALLADLLRPKGFAGLFGAAPSVALATLTLAVISDGPGYAATEARSMVAGEIALVVYAAACVYLLAIRHMKAAQSTLLALSIWGGAASALYLWVLK